MNKLFKRVAAMGAAVMMMASISAMGASAYKNVEKFGAYCSGYMLGESSVCASTSTIDGSTKTAGVTIVLYYKKDGGDLETGSGNAYPRAATAYCSTPDKGEFKSAKVTHRINSGVVYTSTVF